jgi:hypothetical protein
MLEILERGGLVPYMKEHHRLAARTT